MSGISFETLKLEVEELTELLRSDNSFANLRAALADHHMQLEDYLLGGLIGGEDTSCYGVFVGRDGVCTVFEISGNDKVTRWERVDDPASLESLRTRDFEAINVAISLATTDR